MVTTTVILTIIQVVILTFQAVLYRKTSILEQKNNIGYFVIKNTNLDGRRIKYKGKICESNNVYDFDEPISFGLIGKSDTFLVNTDMFVDGNQLVSKPENETLFIIGNALNKLRFEYFKYFKNEISGTKDIKIVFHLKSITGFKYKEIVELRFEEIEDNEKTYWGLNKYKIHFKF